MITMNYEDLAREAVEGMRPNSSRIAHYYVFEGSAMQLVKEISSLPQVDTARLITHLKNYFCVAIKTNSTNC